MALATGNTLILKPSERTPGASLILAELAKEAGIPDGVLQIVHGAHDTVNAILDAPEIKAISFVGGDKAGTYIHQRGTDLGKRVQSNMQAKNHCVSDEAARPIGHCRRWMDFEKAVRVY
jgi:malonate-semialdehyde dehydrogenase (acetylating)/methylmalonate-semialdehyde dehydrogenase